MECSHPPPLTDDQLSAVLDGEGAPAVLAHLAVCPACATRLDQARRVEEALGARLHRWDCPASQELAHYHLGLLGQDAAQQIAAHLEHCVLCAAEITELRAFLAADRPTLGQRHVAARPHPRLGELIARLLLQPPTPALAFRGGVARLIGAEVPGTTIMLEARPAGPEEVLLNGQILDENHQRWVGGLIELRQGGHLRATAEVDDLGTFVGGPLHAAPTELRLTPRQGPAVVVPEVDLAG